MALPIAGASVGDALRFGTTKVENAAWTIAPDGINSGKVSFQSSIYYAGQTGATVWFTFDQAYTKPYLNIPFTFGGDLPLPGVSAGTQTQFGGARLTKAAFDFTPTGWDSSALPKPKIYYSGANGATVDFPFADSYTTPAQLNTPFYFGGNPVVSGVSVGLQTRFGSIQEVRKPLQFLPVGIFADGYGRPRVGVTGSIDFVFTGVYGKPTALNLPYYFGSGALPVAAIGSIFTKFGTASARKTALDILPAGWDSASVGRSYAYYSGANGVGVDFEFGSPYVEPTPLNVPFYFVGDNKIYPFGFDFLQMGSAFTSFRVRTLGTFGFRSNTGASYGLPIVLNDVEAAIDVANRGIYQNLFGMSTVYTVTQTLQVFNTNADFGGIGTPSIGYIVKQYATGVGNIDSLRIGTHAVTHFYQYVAQRSAYTGSQFGTAWASFVVRYLEPVGWRSSQFPVHRVSRNIVVAHTGADYLQFGEAAVEYGNLLKAFGFDSSEVPLVRVSRSPQLALHRQTFSSDVYGVPYVYNSRQYVTQIFDPDYDKYFNRGVGVDGLIYNADRTLGVFGWLSDRIPLGHDVYNAARPLLAEGIAPTSTPGALLVAYAIRSLPLEGWQSSYFSPGGAIYNAARVIAPFGWKSSALGLPNPVFSNLQTIRHHSGSVSTVGTPFVDFAIRTITQILPRGTQYFPEPWVSNYERYIAPPSVDDGFGIGAHYVLGPFQKIIKPFWIKGADTFGELRIYNNTPQLFQQGATQTEYGVRHRIEFVVRTLSVQGTEPANRFGITSVRDRRQTAEIQGFNSLVFSTGLRVVLDNPFLPATQLLSNVGNISPLYPAQFGVVLVQGNPQPEGFHSLKMGQPWVRVQGCVTIWDWPSSQFSFGIPTFKPTQLVAVGNTNLFTAYGKPRFSPHTIWCRLDTPQQAIDNHDGRTFRQIDDPLGTGDTGPFWGNTNVTLGQRTIYQYHSYYSQATGDHLGQPTMVVLKRFVSPTGLNSLRFGYPEFPTIKEVFVPPLNSLVFGTHTVEREPYLGPQTLQPQGLNSLQMGATQAELLNRPVYPVGFVATQWGNNNPMVHFPRHVYPNGYTATQWGTQYVDFAIRRVYPSGHDSFTSGYEQRLFAERMRVRHLTNPVYTVGVEDSALGQPAVMNLIQRINPYQIEGSRCLGHDVTVTHGG